MKVRMAHYRCERCGYEWREEAGKWPWCLRRDRLWGTCRVCGSVYSQWLNHADTADAVNV